LTGSCDKRGLLPNIAIRKTSPRPIVRDVLIGVASLGLLRDQWLLFWRHSDRPLQVRRKLDWLTNTA